MPPDAISPYAVYRSAPADLCCAPEAECSSVGRGMGVWGVTPSAKQRSSSSSKAVILDRREARRHNLLEAWATIDELARACFRTVSNFHCMDRARRRTGEEGG